MNEALMIIDVQMPYSTSNPKTVTALKKALPDLRQRMPVIWVFMGEVDDYSRPRQMRGRRLCDLFNDESIHLNSAAIHPHSDDFVVLKNEMNAFTNPHLEPFLTARGIQTINLAGFHTTQCVFASAAGALRQNLTPRIVQNLTAEYDDRVGLHFQQMLAKQKIKLCKSQDLVLLPPTR